MAPQNFSCLQRLAPKNCGSVVVSAIGKESPQDTKVTDLLVRHFEGSSAAWSAITDKFHRLVSVNSVQIDVDRLLFDAKQRSLKFDKSYCLSLGEELTAKIAAAYLACAYLEADECIAFREGKLCLKTTLRNLKSALKGVKRCVTGGFYGGTLSGRQVFSRGGGDVTGALLAIANGGMYENWTDVNGVCKANPKRIQGASTVLNLSYSEMYALAKGGAEVLHPSAVRYAERFGVPIKVGNYLNEYAPSTLISNLPSRARFLSVAEKKTSDGICATLLHGMNGDEVFRCLSEISANLQETQNWLDTRAVTSKVQWKYCKVLADRVILCTSESILPLLYRVFQNAESVEGLTISRC